MNKEEKLKQLKMALTDHKKLFLNWDGLEITLDWDKEILNYRGRMESEDINACIWKIETLLEIAYGAWENTFLEEYYGR